MERIITIKGKVGLFDVPTYTYADNEILAIRFNTKRPKDSRYVATASCGEQKKTVYLGEDMRMELPPQFIKDGEYNPVFITLEMRDKQGNSVIISGDPANGGFLIEPLQIERVGEYTTAQGWMAKIEETFADILGRLGTVENKVANFEDEGVPLLAEENIEIEGEENHEEN